MSDLSERITHLSQAKLALVALELQSKIEAMERSKTEPIAIIGLGCRFPGGANTAESFWRLLRNGVDAITEVPANRWNLHDFYHPEPTMPGKMSTRWGGFLEQVDQFDANVFGISPREAERMDPQQRILMEVTLEAIEDAGLSPDSLSNSPTGVFVGISTNDYSRLHLSVRHLLDAYVGTGNTASIAANRLSYYFDLHGPSLAIDTACSSALVAVHLACQSLRNGESTIALAGGVNVILSPEGNIIFSKAGLMAADGRCKVFDRRADGYVRSEGAGLIVLKPLPQALADGDQIYAVIRGSAVNQDGRTNGLTSPSRQAQQEVLREAYRQAGVAPKEVQYIEAHGTGTFLGDPIEAKALGTVLAVERSPEQTCLVGSVKSNLGHLEAAAGIAGLIKVALSLKHKLIPPNLHFEHPNPHIPFDELLLRVPRTLEPWSRTSAPALAGVSSFGFGGTNAHVVLEEAPAIEPSGPSRPWQLLLLSAKSVSALDATTANLGGFLHRHPEASLPDIAFTLKVGRKRFAHRRFILCRDHPDALRIIDTSDHHRIFSHVHGNVRQPVVFLFPGLGDHYLQMAHGLYQQEAFFHQQVDFCAETLRPLIGVDLREVIFASEDVFKSNASTSPTDLRRMLRPPQGDAAADTAGGQLNRTALAHPALFTIEYALAQLLIHWGIRPSAMLGYSLGEYVAAAVAGVLSVEDALLVVARRAMLIEQSSHGAMLAVTLPAEKVKPRLRARSWIAAINSPQVCIVAGEDQALADLAAELEQEEGIITRRLKTEHAFHTPMLGAVAEEFKAVLKQIDLHRPEIPYVSNLTGEWIKEGEATDEEYWVKQMCSPIQMRRGIRAVLKRGLTLAVEVGPGQTLASFVRQEEAAIEEEAEASKAGQAEGAAAAMPGEPIMIAGTLRQQYTRASDEEALAEAVGKLWLAGIEVDWKNYYERERRCRVALPTYPFERQRFWFEAGEQAGVAGLLQDTPTETKIAIEDWFHVPTWKKTTWPKPDGHAVPTGDPRSWLIFADEHGLGSRLAKRLKQASHHVTSVSAGSAFSRISVDEFMVNPSSRDDYYSLLQELGKIPEMVVHLWTINQESQGDSRLDLPQEYQERGFYSLLFLAQALGDKQVNGNIDITVVTSNLLQITGREVLMPEKATILGFCRVAPLEYQNLTCRTVDINLSDSDLAQHELAVDQLITELIAKSSDLVVAHRADQRWIENFESVSIEAPSSSSTRLRTKGTYLITGGLGGLGFAIAEYLAKSFAARLILVGRSALPPRETWEELASKDDADEIGQKIRKVRILEEAGAEVLAISADVTDLRRMQEVIYCALDRFGEINGVIHAAGVPGAGLIQLKTPELAARVLAPKVKGTRVLEQVLKNLPLDFIVLFSSITSITGGGPGQVDYCAANAFLDAFAHSRSAADVPTLSITWAEWQWNAWQSGLLSFDAELHAHLQRSRENFGLTFEEGVEAFRRVLSSNFSQVIVSPRNFARLLEESKTFTTKRILEGLARIRPARTKHSRPVIGTAYVAAQSDREKTIAEIWQKYLGINHVGIYDNFFDLGGTSLIGLQVITEIKNSLNVEIPTVALYEAPTISALVGYLSPSSENSGAKQSSRRSTRQSRRSFKDAAGTGIAIVGMSGRFPGARNVNQFWANLVNGVESVTFFSDEELRAAGVTASLLNDPRYVKAGAVLEGIDLFDAQFFGYSPREAELMDPQHRLFLECAVEALEDAGYDSERYFGSIGVFGGSNISTYLLSLYSDPVLFKSLHPVQVGLGNASDSLTTKVSYKLNLRGPSVAVQTFCSTSAVAIHMARLSLLSGESDMALAGGVRIAVPHRVGYLYEAGGIDSPDGHCRAFDSKGKGAVLGNGVALVVLKRLEDALSDGDQIYSVIKSSAINNDGSLKVGYTAPSVIAQAEAVATALAEAGISPTDISYIEAHGTGTEVGDPIEIAALTKAFRKGSDAKGYCAIGSVKTNMGHLDRAAGVTGLIKTALALKYRLIPPSLHFEEPNPQIDFQDSPFFVNTALAEWKTNGKPLRAGVNSLGIGGTNVHFIVEEPPVVEPSSRSRSSQLLLLSAKSELALNAATANLADFLRQQPQTPLPDVAFTLQVGRRRFAHRRFIICQEKDDALQALEGSDMARVFSNYQEKLNRHVVFLFSGLGDHYLNLARGLYRHEPFFRQQVDHCTELLGPHLALDLRDVIFNSEADVASNVAAQGPDLRRMLRQHETQPIVDTTADSSNKLNHTSLAHPALFTIEYALAQLLINWGIIPSAMLGYSLGEYVAAAVAGVMTLEDAVLLVARRAALIEQLPAGAMLAVTLPAEEVEPRLKANTWIAAINSPQVCVIAGQDQAVTQLAQELEREGVITRRLQTEHAFHTPLLDPAVEEFKQSLKRVKLRRPDIPYISNLTGQWIKEEEVTDPEYWVKQMCSPVQMRAGARVLLEQVKNGVLVEVGPGQTLGSFVRQEEALLGRESIGAGQEERELVAIVGTLRQEHSRASDEEVLAEAVGKLWLAGVEVNWENYYEAERRCRVALPTYPFERQRFWIEPQQPALMADINQPKSMKKSDIGDWFYLPVWKEVPLSQSCRQLGGERTCWLAFLDDCGVGAQIVERLKGNGSTVVSVNAGKAFSRLDENSYLLDPTEPAGYRALLSELQAADKLPDAVVYLWALTQSSDLAFDEAQNLGFYGLIFLAQALAKENVTKPLRIEVISNNVQRTSDAEVICPEKATLAGPCKVIPQEYPNITCRNLDVVLPVMDIASEQQLIDLLSAELTTQTSDITVAYRDDRRLVQSFESIYLGPAGEGTKGLREAGVYIITGGLGGVGFRLAEFLARSVRARLVLTGRSSMPERESWDSWLASNDEQNPTSRRIRKVQALEALGSEVLTLSADVADEQQMREVMMRTLETFGELHGVIHGAGIVTPDSFRAVQQMDRASCERHFRPKAHGLIVLENLLKGRKLDFCFVLSSLSSVLGGLGFAAYAAANIFMDAFVIKQNRADGTRWMSINWDIWNVGDESQETKIKGLQSTVEEYTLSPDEGVEAFGRFLASDGITYLINSTGDLKVRINQWIQRTPLQQRTGATALYSRPNLLNTYVPANTKIEQKIAGVLQSVLGIEKVGIHDNYFDLGGTSLTAIQVISELQKELNLQISPVTLFEAPTVCALAKRLSPAGVDADHDSFRRSIERRQRTNADSGNAAIAIIGMSGRFPGARNIEEFWENLRAGVESVSFFSEDELRRSGVQPALLRNPAYVRARPIIEDIDLFDANFFGYSPREADFMDPQHRVFIECAWNALEDAGYDSQRYDGDIGVFAGSNISTYAFGLLTNPATANTLSDLEAAIAWDRDSLTTSVSYKLNLKGPSFAVQTFCSTSLVAVHLACQSIRNGECDMALAGGVSIRVPQKIGYQFQAGGQDSPDGHTRTFDAEARGTVFGDGVGVVVLKKLEAALADGDCIQAVIKGSAINNDGSVKVGYTAPSVDGQATVVATALANAGVDAATIDYVEAHGTATELGDPIEVTALTKAFNLTSHAKRYCAIGSVKSNMGHLDRAAGVTGLIKTALALKHKLIPPSLHFKEPNPKIDFQNSPFFVNVALAEWKANGKPRRAGVNSIGVGGTNVHVVMEEAPPVEPSSKSRPWQLLLLSARSEPALDTATTNLADYLRRHPETPLADVAFTLQAGRRRFSHRRFMLCQDRDDALRVIEGADPQRSFSHHQESASRPVNFLFPGLGDHYSQMAQGLYQQEEFFRQQVDLCCELLRPHLSLDLREVLFSPADDIEAVGASFASSGSQAPDLRRMLRQPDGQPTVDASSKANRLNETALAHPALFTIEYALAQQLIHWGIRPTGLLGYSLGEYVAAAVAGVFSLEDALLIVARRAALIERLPGAAMLAVTLPAEVVETRLKPGSWIAAINSPQVCVVAGNNSIVIDLAAEFEHAGTITRRLQTKHAFHTPLLEPIAEEFQQILKQVQLRRPEIPFISNLTGEWITEEEATDAEYWARQMCSPIQMRRGIREILKQVGPVLLEVGPGQSLGSFVRQEEAEIEKEAEAQEMREAALPDPVAIVGTLRQQYMKVEDQQLLVEAVGKLCLAGVDLDWEHYYEAERRHRVSLPAYPFERQRFWIEAGEPITQVQKKAQKLEDLEKKTEIGDWFYIPIWKQSPPLVNFNEGTEATRRCWMVLTHDCGLGTRVVETLLSTTSEPVITVTAGELFAKITDLSYTIDPRRKEHYELLFDELKERGVLLNTIVHMWNVTPRNYDRTLNNLLHSSLENGLYSVLFLAQSLGERNANAIKITVISNSLYRVTGDEELCAEKATIIGPCAAIPLEYQNMQCQCVDISVPAAGSQVESELAERLIQEAVQDASPSQIAYRGSTRWEQTFEPIELQRMDCCPARLRAGGVYLITGGVGGIGFAVAEYLARTVKAKLVLTSRTGLPPREECEQTLKRDDESSEVKRKLEQVRALEEMGAEVLILDADVSDSQRMQSVISLTQERFGRLNGIFHAAGVPASGLMHLKTTETIAGVLAPKVKGTLVLSEVTKDIPLDFMVLFSSMTSITGGGPGQLDYCAANAFLDAFARAESSRERFVVSINWGEWQWDAWQEGLFGFDPLIQAYFKENRKKFGITFDEGMDALSRILSNQLSQVVVSTQDFNVLLELSRSFTVSRILEEVGKTYKTHEVHPRPVLGTSYVAPQTDVERKIANTWQELLRIDQIGLNDNFFELGGNSLVGLNLINQMRNALGVTIPAFALYQAPSVGAMAKFVASNGVDQTLADRQERGEIRRKRQQRRRQQSEGAPAKSDTSP